MRAALLLSLLVVATAQAGPRDYVGSAACGSCHPQALAVWEKTAHARAGDPAVLGKRARDGACLTCHGTGEGVSAKTLRPGVGCEACHGGGVAYAVDDVMRDLPLSRSLGLRADAASTCQRCHRARTAPGTFDPVAGWQRIAH